MKRWIVFVALTMSCSIAFSQLHAQDIEDFVSKYTGVNGEGYLQPLADAFGANLNSGLYQTAHIPAMGFSIRGGVVIMTAPISDDNKVFTATTEFPFTPEQTAEAPTIFGDVNPVTVSGEGGTVYTFPGGFAFNQLPFLVPQVTIGSIRGSEVTIRYFQVTLGDNIGDVKLFGFGARHSISQYLKDPPVDIAAGFFFQSFDVGDIISANTSYFGLQLSHTRSVLTLYGGPGVETSSLDIAYQFDDDTSIEFEMDSNNSFRFTTGVAVDLRIIRFFIDYNFASQSAISLGLGLGSL
jgi:hypothetical protein